MSSADTPSGRGRLTAAVNWINLTTLCGLLVARTGGTRARRAGRVLVADGYRGRLPRQTCFTVGNVIITRGERDWLLDPAQARLLGHETRHAGQYAWLGPLFFPLYGLASAWSWLAVGEYGARNLFERRAGLADGGYTDQPLRPWAEFA